jgi:hypothetical protein
MVLPQAYSPLEHWLKLLEMILPELTPMVILQACFQLGLKGPIVVGEQQQLVKVHWHFLHIRRHLQLVLIRLEFGRVLAIRPRLEQMELEQVSRQAFALLELGLEFQPAFVLRRLRLLHKRHFH